MVEIRNIAALTIMAFIAALILYAAYQNHKKKYWQLKHKRLQKQIERKNEIIS